MSSRYFAYSGRSVTVEDRWRAGDITRARPYSGAFFQSLRKRAIPMSVRGWTGSFSITAYGIVAMSAPSRAASSTCIGWRTLATQTSVGYSWWR